MNATRPAPAPPDPAQARTQWLPQAVLRWRRQGGEPSASVPLAPRIALIEGSGPSLNTEERDLLRTRLRIFLTPLALGFVAFFVRNRLFLNSPRPDRLVDALHLALALLLVGLLALLWSRRPVDRAVLRAIELGTLALVMAFLLVLQCRRTLAAVESGDAMLGIDTARNVSFTTFALIVLYGLLIPNTLGRAAAILVPTALLPPATVLALRAAFPSVRAYLAQYASFERASNNALMLALALFVALYGTQTIHRLRCEVREARRLGQYRLRRRIGIGGMGEVYLAEHDLLKRPAAIKLIRPDVAGDPRVLGRFELEAQATASLSHPNTVEVYDYGRTDDGTFYYVMEYLPGLSLAAIVQNYGAMPPGRAVYLLRQACSALTEAHEFGLVHRDLKPGNIFASHRGGRHDVAKLLDFGLVKPVEPNPDGLEVSGDGRVRGSPLYMSPEQATGQAIGPASDLYSLGAVAYFLLTGRPPFVGQTAVAVMVAHARDPVERPSRHRPDLPADLEQIVLRCLKKEPAHRHSSAAELESALAACACAADWDPARAATWWAHVKPPAAGDDP